jgi:hypothetical protein
LSEDNLEAPAADSIDQMQSVDDDAGEPLAVGEPGELPLDANEADAVDQHLTVELDDEDDYR